MREAPVTLETLSICTAFNFVYGRELRPCLTGDILSDKPNFVLCISLETGSEIYKRAKIIIEPIFKFLFERIEDKMFWVHGKTSNLITSTTQDESGKLMSFNLAGYGRCVTVQIPFSSECTLIDK